MAETLTTKPAASNVTPATFLEAYRELVQLKQEADAANGVYRSRLKKAKAAGLNTSAIVEAMRLKKQDPDTATLYYRDLDRYMAWLKQPLGSQGALFAENAADTHVPGKASDEHVSWEAEDAGYQAGVMGRDKVSNPMPLTSPLFHKWEEGWLRGQRHILAGMAPKKDPNAPKPPKEEKPKKEKKAKAEKPPGLPLGDKPAKKPKKSNGGVPRGVVVKMPKRKR